MPDDVLPLPRPCADTRGVERVLANAAKQHTTQITQYKLRFSLSPPLIVAVPPEGPRYETQFAVCKTVVVKKNQAKSHFSSAN